MWYVYVMALISAFRMYREQRIRVQAVLLWAEKHLGEGELLTASIKGFERHYVMHDGHLLTNPSSSERIPAIIVCEPKGLHELRRSHEEGWSPLFRSPLFEVWEHIGRFSLKAPSRHGLSKKDSTTLLGIARKVLLHKVATGNSTSPSEFSKEQESLPDDVISADIAVWVNGRLRASMIVFDKPIVDAVVEAAMRASNDRRFRPLLKEELAHARLELTLWSDLEIPLPPLEIARGDVYHTKAYLARKEGKIGLYAPTVFNCTRFTSLTDFLDTLARNKGGFSPNGSQFSLVETHGWIESDDKEEVVPLCGPIVTGESIQGSICLALPRIMESALRSADWLVSLQESSGYMESFIDPFESYPNKSTQWGRLAFTAYALATLSSELKNLAYHDAAKRLFEYLSKHARQNIAPGAPQVLLEVYLGRTAQALSIEIEVHRAADIVLRDALVQTYEPILYLQSSAFLYAVGGVYRTRAEELYRAVADRFLTLCTTSNLLSLAAYAELITLAPLFGDSNTAKCVRQWYKDLQHADGSFPNTPESSFAYTRGTGKIFEVMTDDPERYQEQLRSSASWMMDMQYDKENLYFIADAKKKSELLGGFRHDAENQQAWIDSAAHFILGAVRLRARCFLG